MDKFDPGDYVWRLNKNNNFEGVSVNSGVHTFTWQPHGSQLTLIRQVSESARTFQIKKPNELDQSQVLTSLGYSDDWVEFV